MGAREASSLPCADRTQIPAIESAKEKVERKHDDEPDAVITKGQPTTRASSIRRLWNCQGMIGEISVFQVPEKPTLSVKGEPPQGSCVAIEDTYHYESRDSIHWQ